MSYKLIYPQTYIKQAKKFIKKHTDSRKQYQKTLELLGIDPYHISLRLHSLQGKLKKLSSVSVNFRYRIVINMLIRDNEIILIDAGHHDQVY